MSSDIQIIFYEFLCQQNIYRRRELGIVHRKTGHEGGGPPSPQRGERGNHHPSRPDIETSRILRITYTSYCGAEKNPWRGRKRQAETIFLKLDSLSVFFKY